MTAILIIVAYAFLGGIIGGKIYQSFLWYKDYDGKPQKYDSMDKRPGYMHDGEWCAVVFGGIFWPISIFFALGNKVAQGTPRWAKQEMKIREQREKIRELEQLLD